MTHVESYVGHESLLLGNDQLDSISHIGKRQNSNGNSIFKLNNLFHVPQLAKIHISVRQMCIDNYVLLNFFLIPYI